MQIEALVYFSAFILVLFGFAEQYKKNILGIFGSIALIVLAMWIFTDDIQFQTGYNTLQNSTINNILVGDLDGTNTLDNSSIASYLENYNETTTGTGTQTKTTTYTYSAITTPYFQFNTFLALLLLGIAIYLFGYYTFSLTNYRA